MRVCVCLCARVCTHARVKVRAGVARVVVELDATKRVVPVRARVGRVGAVAHGVHQRAVEAHPLRVPPLLRADAVPHARRVQLLRAVRVPA